MASAVVYDVELDDDGDLPIGARLCSGFKLILQRASLRVRTHLREHFCDISLGLPYEEWVQAKPPPTATVAAAVAAALASTPGVDSVTDLTWSFDSETRTIAVACTVQTVDGDERIEVFPLGAPGSGNRNPALRTRSGRLRGS